MALYNGTGPATGTNVRLDNCVWDKPGPGAQIRGWGNPRLSPSHRFTLYDGTAADLDRRFDGLPQETKNKWKAYWKEYFDLLFCPDAWMQYYYKNFGPPEEDTYIACNLSRLTQGLPQTDEPPALNTLPVTDDVEVSQNPDVCLTWLHGAPTIPYQHVAIIFIRPRNNFASFQTTFRRYRQLDTIFITQAVPASIQAALNNAGMNYPGLVLDLLIYIAELGCFPIVRIHKQFRLEANPMISWSSATVPATRPDGSPLVEGDTWYNSVTADWWLWHVINATGHWISQQIYTFARSGLYDFWGGTTNDEGAIWCSCPRGYPVLPISMSALCQVAAPNDNDNYWTFVTQLRNFQIWTYENQATGPDTRLRTAGVWEQISGTFPEVVITVPTSYSWCMAVHKTGAPGALYIHPSIHYRLVQP
jgi:hypothetical protein